MTIGASQALRERGRQNLEAAMLSDEAAVYSVIKVPSEDFGETETYVLEGVYPANFWTVSGREALILQQIDVKAEVIVVVPVFTVLDEKSQIVYTVTETGEIRHFEVSHVFARSRPQTQRVACIEYKLTANPIE